MNLINWKDAELVSFMNMCNIHKEEIHIRKFPLFKDQKEFGLLLTIKNKRIMDSLLIYIRQCNIFKAHWNKYFNQIVIFPYGYSQRRFQITPNKWIVNLKATYENDMLIYDPHDGFDWKFMFTLENDGLIRMSSCDFDQTRWINFIPETWTDEDHVVMWHSPWNCVNLHNAKKLYTDKIVCAYF